jgi:hypothetical protein
MAEHACDLVRDKRARDLTTNDYELLHTCDEWSHTSERIVQLAQRK